MKPTKFLSYSSGKLVKGCQECVLGNKTVLFITGKCNRNCYYCPLPESRKNLDVVYANERKLSDVDAVSEAIEEAKLCNSKGMGITGGNPLLVLNRTIKFVKAFKKIFGRNFHIHIYLPTDNITKQKLEKLAKSGIDEIRFHPYFLSKDEKELKAIETAYQLKKKYGWKVGIEIPAVPKTEKATIKFLKSVKHLDFLNLNEFEMPSLNGENLQKRKMSTIGNSVAIRGSEKTALKVLNEIAKSHIIQNIHYCSAATKNLFQFKNRLKNRLKNIKKLYDIITKDNDLLHGAIYCSIKPEFGYQKKLENIKRNKKKYNQIIKKLDSFRNYIIKTYQIPKNLIEIDRQFLRILTSVEIAEKLKNEIKKHDLNPALVVELPTYDKIMLFFEWL